MIQHQAIKVDAEVAGALPVASAPLWHGESRAPVAWAVAAHGGAGATTLAHVLAPVGDACAHWPTHDDHPYCVVVCRSTRSGLDAAQSAVLQARSGHADNCTVLGVVIVADAPGKTPKSLAQRETVLEDLTTVWRIPYLPSIRENRVEELAQWAPGTTSNEQAPTSRLRRRTPDVREAVPDGIVSVGEAIFHAAYSAYQNHTEGK